MTDPTHAGGPPTGPPPLARGLWGILPTPFDHADELDEASLARQTRFFADTGPAGLVALGVFGEGASLDSAEQRRVVEVVAEHSGDLPLVVGLSARTTAAAVEQARALAPLVGPRLAGLMVQVHSPVADVVVDHLRAIAAAAGGAGIVLQDYPVASGVTISPEAVAQVVGRSPSVVAVKAESSPSPRAVAALAGTVPVPVLGGLGGVNLLDELALGAGGAMTGFSHPEVLRATIDAYDDGGFAAAREVFAPWLPLATMEGQVGLGLGIRKEVLRRRGVIDTGRVRPPAASVPEALLALIDHHLATLPVVPTAPEVH